MVEIAIFVCQGCQQRENDQQHAEWFKAYPKVAKVGKELADVGGRETVFSGDVYDFNDQYCGVRYPDGGLEELNRREIKHGKELATASV